MSVGTALKHLMMVRKGDRDKEPYLLEWLRANKEKNGLDESVLKYPKTELLVAHTNGTSHVTMPAHTVVMLESTGFNPESSAQDKAMGLVEIVKAVAAMAHVGGNREIYFAVSDDVTAQAAEYVGFREYPHRMMRLKLPND